MRQSASQHGAAAGREGFTLIELLTVVAIIGLLVGMVVPTIQSVLEAQVAMKTLVRIKNLAAGVHGWKMGQTGNKFYPGQKDPQLLSSGKHAGKASAFLASRLFGDYDHEVNGEPNFPPPVDGYAAYEPGMLDSANGYETGAAYSILDCYNDTMAILYYPSRIGEAGRTQFKPGDNSFYTTAETTAPNKSILTLVDGGTQTFMDRAFILTAAGKPGGERGRREYFNETTLKNWGD